MKVLNVLHCGFVAVEFDGTEVFEGSPGTVDFDDDDDLTKIPEYACTKVMHINDLPEGLWQKLVRRVTKH